MMEKFVKMADLKNYAKWAKMIDLPLDEDALALIKYADERAVDNVSKIVRCGECIHKREYEPNSPIIYCENFGRGHSLSRDFFCGSGFKEED